MTVKRTERPAKTFRTRGGATVSVDGSAPSGGPLALPEWHVAALLAAYRIATYQPRSREAWREALEVLDLEPGARKVAADYLQERWGSTPYDPADLSPTAAYGEGSPVRLVFAAKEQGRGA